LVNSPNPSGNVMLKALVFTGAAIAAIERVIAATASALRNVGFIRSISLYLS
jgi:hypothetical protein